MAELMKPVEGIPGVNMSPVPNPLMGIPGVNMSPIPTKTATPVAKPVAKAPAPVLNVVPKPTGYNPTFSNGTTLYPTTKSGINPNKLTSQQLATIKKNNPELYKSMYGSSPTKVSTTDIGTSPINLSQQSTGGAGTTSMDNANAEALLSAEKRAAETAAGDQAAGSTPTNPRDAALQNWMKASELLVGRSQGELDIKKEMEVYKQEEIAAKAQQTYEEAVVAQRRKIQEMRENPEGMLAGALEANIQNYKYESDQNIADLAMASYYAQGSYDRVVRMAQDAIDAKYEPIVAQMNHFKDMYTLLGDDLTEKEKMQLTYQMTLAEGSIKALRDAQTEATRAAGINGATPEVMSAIRAATTPEGVWAAAGKFGIDPTLKLAQDKFAWDKWFAQVQLNAKNAEAATEAEIKVLEQGESSANLLYQAQKLKTAVSEARANKAGLNAATGAMKGPWGAIYSGFGEGASRGGLAGPVGAIGGGLWGAIKGGVSAPQARADFENDVKLIYAAQALTEIGNLGYSLAPITEKELALVGSMASNLSSSVTIAEDGTMKISGSTKEFEKNMEELDKQLDKTVKKLSEDPSLAAYLASSSDAELTAYYNSL